MIHLVGLGHAVITVGVTRLTQASETLFASALLFVREAGKPVERRRIIELLWPRASAQRANHRLRQTLYRLNTLGAALRSDRGHITLPVRSAQSDFGEVLAAGRSADPNRVAELVQGPFLPGYAPRFSPSCRRHRTSGRAGRGKSSPAPAPRSWRGTARPVRW